MDAITRQQSTFTLGQLQALVVHHSDGKDQFDHALGAMRAAPEMVALGWGGRGREWFSHVGDCVGQVRRELSAGVMAECLDAAD